MSTGNERRGSQQLSPAEKLRAVLGESGAVEMPCCHDALSAKLIERAGFPVIFMSGFAVSGARLAVPDTQLISYGEMVDTGRAICSAVSTPVIGDGDTGYGNAINTKRTVAGYAAADFAGIMIEDQVAPKRCGHVAGKQVVSFDEAVARVQAACDARDESRHDILIMARTDALHSHGLDEAIRRMVAFEAAGVDILFLEALRTVEEMEKFCAACPNTPKMANLIEGGATPMLSTEELGRIGFKLVARPVDLFGAAIRGMELALDAIKRGDPTSVNKCTFKEIKDIVGFPEYHAEEKRYSLDSQRAAEMEGLRSD